MTTPAPVQSPDRRTRVEYHQRGADLVQVYWWRGPQRPGQPGRAFVRGEVSEALFDPCPVRGLTARQSAETWVLDVLGPLVVVVEAPAA